MICNKGVWGRGSHRKRLNLALFCGPDPAAGGFFGGVLVGLENMHDDGSCDAVSGCRFGGRGGCLGRQTAAF